MINKVITNKSIFGVTAFFFFDGLPNDQLLMVQQSDLLTACSPSMDYVSPFVMFNPSHKSPTLMLLKLQHNAGTIWLLSSH